MSASDSSAPAVEVRELVREIKGGIRAVARLDLAVRPGEIYGFLGPNGAGKTTVVRILKTLLRPTSGTARVAGYDVVADADAVRLSIGVALQEAAIDPLMTGRELLRMRGALHGLRGPAARERAATVSGIEPSLANTLPGLLALAGMFAVFGALALFGLGRLGR